MTSGISKKAIGLHTVVNSVSLWRKWDNVFSLPFCELWEMFTTCRLSLLDGFSHPNIHTRSGIQVAFFSFFSIIISSHLLNLCLRTVWRNPIKILADVALIVRHPWINEKKNKNNHQNKTKTTPLKVDRSVVGLKPPNSIYPNTLLFRFFFHLGKLLFVWLSLPPTRSSQLISAFVSEK